MDCPDTFLIAKKMCGKIREKKKFELGIPKFHDMLIIVFVIIRMKMSL